MPTSIPRRDFMKLGLATTAGVAAGIALDAQGTATVTPTPTPAAAPTPAQTPAPQPNLPPLGQGEPPAMIFQAYPGGTGAVLEKLRKERGSAAFDRVKMTVEPWTGAVPTDEETIAFLPVNRLAALIQARKITSVKLTQIYLDRLKRFDPVLLCAVTIMEEQGMAEAKKADAEISAGRYRGPLHGIPYGVKDLFSTKGVRTTWGSKDFENRIIDEDAEVVIRLRDAGAVLIAKLATGRFASGDQWYRGQTKNPWNLNQGSSGSSAGPSSATAAGCVAFGIGTETRGSIVSPATQCGLSALRPTFGRVSRYGGMVLAWSMDKVGPICRTIEDCALVFNAIQGVDEKDPSTITAPFQFDRHISLAKLRIGYDENDTRAKVLLDKLREMGANLKPIKARPTGASTALNAESAAAFDMYFGNPTGTTPEAASRGGGGGGGGAGRAGGAAGRAGDPAAAGRGAILVPVTGSATGDPARGADPAAAPAPGRGGGGGGGGNSRTATALDFLQNQRRRLIVMQQMAVVMNDFDMYVTSSGDVSLTNDTGHPAAVVQTGFGARQTGRQGGGGGGGGRAGATGAAGAAGATATPTPTPTPTPAATPAAPAPEQPLVTTIVGQLFNDDKILSVAHLYQVATDWHKKHPKLGGNS